MKPKQKLEQPLTTSPLPKNLRNDKNEENETNEEEKQSSTYELQTSSPEPKPDTTSTESKIINPTTSSRKWKRLEGIRDKMYWIKDRRQIVKIRNLKKF